MEDNFNVKENDIQAERDPRIHYMKKCQENKEKSLPIFDKVTKKTLCL